MGDASDGDRRVSLRIIVWLPIIALAGSISWREALVVAVISGIVYAVVGALIKLGRVVSPAVRRRFGSR